MRLGFVSFFLACVACVSSTKSNNGEQADPGPRSGLAETGLVRDLSPADRELLCSWWNTTLGGEQRMQSCTHCNGDACTDWDVAVSSQAECVEWLAGLVCDATVRDAEDCAFAEAPDLCEAPDACRVFIGC